MVVRQIKFAIHHSQRMSLCCEHFFMFYFGNISHLLALAQTSNPAPDCNLPIQPASCLLKHWLAVQLQTSIWIDFL